MPANNVTNITDARALRAMGAPLDTPVVDGGELPAAAAKAMDDGFKAAIKFRTRIYSFVENQNASTFAAMERAFGRFMKATEAPAGDPLAAAILENEFSSIRAEWSDAFDRLDAGETIADVRGMWPFTPTEASKRRQQNPGM